MELKNIAFRAIVALVVVAGYMPNVSWSMMSRTPERLTPVWRRLASHNALLRARIAANPTVQAPRTATLGQLLVARKVPQRNLITTESQQNYRDYSNYGYTRPFNYSILGSMGAAAVGFTLVNRKPAQALIAAEGPTMFSFSFNGYQKNVIFLPDIHWENDRDYYYYAGSTINEIRERQWKQILDTLTTLSQSSTPTTLYLEHALWEGRPDLHRRGLLNKMIRFAIDHDWHFGNLRIIPIDNRTQEEDKELIRVIPSLSKDKLHSAEFIKKHEDDAFTIIHNSKIPKQIKDLLDKNVRDDRYKITPQQWNEEAFIGYISLKMDALIACKIWESLLRDGDENIILYAGADHNHKAMKTLFQAQHKEYLKAEPAALYSVTGSPLNLPSLIEKASAKEDFGAVIIDYLKNNKTHIPLDGIAK